jgi:hypothetical protein
MSLGRAGGIVGALGVAAVALWLGWGVSAERDGRHSVRERPEVNGGGKLVGRLHANAPQAPDHDLPSRRPQKEESALPEDLDTGAFMPTWEAIDMEEVRRAMPDNMYWDMSAPTQDEAELERRRLERERWNVEYGKVLSGTGTEEDVRNYYDHRARLFGDYIEFTTYLIENYGETLSERDLGLLMLARKLSQARIEGIPRKVEESLARTRAQIAAREAWKADQKLFAGGEVPDENTR